MVEHYLDYFVFFVGDSIAALNSFMIVPGVSLLGFMIAVSLLCILIGGLLIR